MRARFPSATAFEPAQLTRGASLPSVTERDGAAEEAMCLREATFEKPARTATSRTPTLGNLVTSEVRLPRTSAESAE